MNLAESQAIQYRLEIRNERVQGVAGARVVRFRMASPGYGDDPEPVGEPRRQIIEDVGTRPQSGQEDERLTAAAKVEIVDADAAVARVAGAMRGGIGPGGVRGCDRVGGVSRVRG
jgi:hypothetical protein